MGYAPFDHYDLGDKYQKGFLKTKLGDKDQLLRMVAVMKANGIDASNRLLAVEHPVIMILAIVFITIGWSKHKKKIEDTAKFKTFAIFYGLALLLVLSRIPWNNWL